MLITFKSKAAADVLMYEQHAKRILDLLHKDVKRGVITADELDGALQALEPVLAESRNHAAAECLHHDDKHQPGGDEHSDEHEASEYVSLATRAYPLLTMLREAKRIGAPVTWGF